MRILIILFFIGIQSLSSQIINKEYIKEKHIVSVILDTSLLSDNHFIVSDISGKQFDVNKIYLDYTNDGYKFLGSCNNNRGFFIMIKKKNKMFARAHLGNFLYEFRNLSSMNFEVTKYLAKPEGNECGMNELSYDFSQDILNDESANLRDTPNPNVCNLRLLVGVTQIATNSTVTLEIEAAVMEMNQILSNSQVFHSIELVGVLENLPNDLEDPGFNINSTAAINDIIDPNDGVLDNIHIEKNNRSADVFALIIENRLDGAYGVASSIGMNNTHWSCIVDKQAMNGYFSLMHEIGHLLGAKHNNECITCGPYDNARGFQRTTNGNRVSTIMASDHFEEPNGQHNRVPFFSNDNFITQFGVLGTLTEDCSPSINISLNLHSKGGRDIPTDITVQSQDLDATYFATTSILTSPVFNSNCGYLVAGDNIIISDDARLSGEFLLRIEQPLICGTGTIPGTITNDEVEEEYDEKIRINEIEISTYPNPFKNEVYLDFNKTIAHASIYLCDSRGQMIDQFMLANLKSYSLNLKNLTSGTYLLKLYFNKEYKNEILKIIKQ